ncbi:MAG: hypothetical protein EOO88_18700 [Pedobacter sp.]|nr:MAG: hypothetical protein EOO88_18700 [Pedobacter sp.]
MNKASHAPTIAERLGSDFESIDFDVSNGTLKADYLPGEINVDASRMSSADYKAMEKEISEARVDTATFSVYAWNDVSGPLNGLGPFLL